MKTVRRLLSLLCIACLALLAPAARATGINGLWTTASGDYALFLQDATSGATFALQVPASLSSMRVWLGAGSTSSLALQSLVQPADVLAATISGNSMHGTTTLSGAMQPFDAQLSLAWVGTPYAGIWQKSAAANAYLVFCVLETGSARLALQIDVTVNADKTLSQQIFTGALTGNQFTGVSASGAGQTSRLEFSSGSLTGSLTTAGRPPQVTSFGATQIVKIAP